MIFRTVRIEEVIELRKFCFKFRWEFVIIYRISKARFVLVKTGDDKVLNFAVSNQSSISEGEKDDVV